MNQSLGNPLRLRRPLDKGVRIIMAHCASQVQRPASTPCCNAPSRVLHSGLLRLAESAVAPPTLPVCVRVCVCVCVGVWVCGCVGVWCCILCLVLCVCLE